MAKRPRTSRKSPNLAVKTVEETDERVRRVVDRSDYRRGDILDVTRRNVGKITGTPYEIVDAFGKKRRAIYEVAMGKGKPSKLYDNELQRIYRPGEAPSASDRAERAIAKSVPETRQRLDDRHPDEDPEDLAADEEDAEMQLPDNAEEERVAVVDDAGGDDEVNLTAWAKGLVNYRFALVRDRIHERYGKMCDTEGDAAEFLAEQGLQVAPARLAKMRKAPSSE